MPALFWLFVLLLQFILYLTHWFLYFTIIRFFNLPSLGAVYLKYFLTAASFSFILASLLVFRHHDWLSRTFYTITASWLGLLNFLLLGSILAWTIFLIGRLTGFTTNKTLLLSLTLGLGLIISLYGLINAALPRVKSIAVRLNNLPDYWLGKSLVFISDVHLGPIYTARYAQSLVNKINQLKPTLVLIGGDYYDGTSIDAATAATPLKNLQTTDGVYFITGNHEPLGDSASYTMALRNVNVHILNNNLVNLQGLQLIGFDYASTTTKADYQKIAQSINFNPELPSLVIRHTPTYLDVLQNLKMGDLQLYGHTHRGQMWPYHYLTHWVYRGFDYGFKRLNQSLIYTSGGVGTWGPPLKVGSSPEIVLIKFLQ